MRFAPSNDERLARVERGVARENSQNPDSCCGKQRNRVASNIVIGLKVRPRKRARRKRFGARDAIRSATDSDRDGRKGEGRSPG